MNLKQLAKDLDLDAEVKIGEDRLLVVLIPDRDSYRLRIYSCDSMSITLGETDDWYYAVMTAYYWRWEILISPKQLPFIERIREFAWTCKIPATARTAVRYVGIRRDVLMGPPAYWLELPPQEEFFAVDWRGLRGLEDVLARLDIGTEYAERIQSALSRKLAQNVKKG